jgi:hypothetical protein
LARGVKQGEVLSGALFSFFMHDFIQECCQSGIGANFIGIIVAILAFCEDVCLLSPDESELQILLNICDNYSKYWAIKYNVSKCKYMVFGSNKFNNNIFILNNLPLSYTTV